MDPEYSVLIYSKYSSNCKRFIDTMNKAGVDSYLYLLCIDNEEVRKRVQNDKKITITIVPCVLSVFSTGGVEKYDGEYAFKWLESIIEENTPKVSEIPKIEEEEKEPEPEMAISSAISYNPKTSIDDIPQSLDSDRSVMTNNVSKNIKPSSETHTANDIAKEMAKERENMDKKLSQ